MNCLQVPFTKKAEGLITNDIKRRPKHERNRLVV